MTPTKRFAVVAIWVVALIAAVGAGSPQSPDAARWRELEARTDELWVAGQVDEAAAAARQSLDAATTDGEIARSLDRLGFLLYTLGNAAEAEPHLRRSLEIRAAAFSVDSLEYAETANDLAMLLRDDRKMDEAKALAAQSVSNRRRILGADSALLAESLNTQATVISVGGDYGAAVIVFEQAVAIHESIAIDRRNHEEYGTLCVNLAGTYQRLGRLLLAERTFEKGLAALRIKPGVTHPAYAVSLFALATLENDLARYNEAERLYAEGDPAFIASLGASHPMYGAFLNNRGFFHQTIGNLAAAEADYRRAIEIEKAAHVPAPILVSALRNLAHVVYARDHEAGERLFSEAVESLASLPNPPAFEYASLLLSLAGTLRDRGALAEARANASKALAAARSRLGDRHPLVAAALRELALIAAASGDAAGAERSLKESIALSESVLGLTHPDITRSLNALAGVYVDKGDFAAALALLTRSADIREQSLDGVIEIGSAAFKAASMSAAVDWMSSLLAMQSRIGSQAPGVRALAFEVVTQRKARILEQLRDSRQRLRENADPVVSRQVTQWQSMLECRTSLTMALGYREMKAPLVGTCGLEDTVFAGRYEGLLSQLRAAVNPDVAASALDAIAALQRAGDDVETVLNRLTGGVKGGRARISVSEISARLANDEVLIELIATTTAPQGGERRYSAFVLDRAGRLDWIDIGASPPIDAAVRDMLAAANDWSVSLQHRERRQAVALEATARDAIAELSRRVWTPLQPLLADRPQIRKLRIAPDGALNLVPFEALSDGQDLIDRFTVSYIPSGRDLAAVDTASAALSPPVFVVSPGATPRPKPVAGPPAAAFRLDSLATLAAAPGEASDLRKLLPTSVQYSGAEATERHVKDLHGPWLMHVLGHGIVLNQEDCAAAPCVPGRPGSAPDGMSHSAIVLEEAYGRGAGSTEDGMLTPLELQAIDLRGTEMLVLSQCRMASGIVSFGEGVYGMRRAAAIAGARTFVAPLWNVEDAAERRLMERFYRGLAAGMSRADALRRAKIDLRAARATSSFLYWAPVILSGSASALPADLFEPAK